MSPRGNDEALKALSRELNDWCAAEGLEPASADEILSEEYAREPRNEVRCQWLENFIKRWDEATP